VNIWTRLLLFSFLLIIIIGVVLLSSDFFDRYKPTPDMSVDTEQVSLDGYVGSRSCRECHERFYNLWSPSHHGKAMQPVEDVIKNKELELTDKSLKVGDHWFEVLPNGSELFMIEKESKKSQKELNRYPAKWALGGRNIYYFLTPFSGGRLQTMPLAYDINRKEWYSNPASAVRHFVDMNASDEEIDWKHSLYTFNTTCHSCHVSQLQKNYNLSTNTYHTTWREPGINCETCHGPSEEHIRVCREAEKNNEVPEDLKIISVKNYTPQQHNSACASCHAKGVPLTKAYNPGDEFFQHFDLITLESPDYYPDGRDLGENYTMTTWFQSKCTADKSLNCVSCHTSSGRYRYKDNDNEICASCHTDKLQNFEEHTYHKLEDSITCVSCHMPTTEFARMTRSDHSMRPPTPATTIAFGSPNACNLCHDEEDAQWANEYVKKWHGNYQNEILELATLIHKGRNNDFSNANQMLELINKPEVNVIFRNSMIRILSNHQIADKQSYFLKALEDDSPLIRGSAAEVLRMFVTQQTKQALMTALNDKFLLVRNKASGSLSSFPKEFFTQVEWQRVERSLKEYENALLAYPDTWSAHYNLGNYFQGQGRHQEAVSSYEKAIQLEEEALLPMVNASIAYNVLGNNIKAEEKLQQALRLDPNNSAVNLNYGLLLAEKQRFEEAKSHLLRAFENDTTLSQAAYNLAILSAQTDMSKAEEYISRAYAINSDNPSYGYTYAYYAFQNGHHQQAVRLLKSLISKNPDYIDAYLFLASIYEQKNDLGAAIKVYESAAKLENLPPAHRQNIQMRANQLKQ
jgi:tetratricopeptide (TPR) repeat protein